MAVDGALVNRGMAVDVEHGSGNLQLVDEPTDRIDRALGVRVRVQRGFHRAASAAAATLRVVLDARPQQRVTPPPVRPGCVNRGSEAGEVPGDVEVPLPHREVKRAVAVVRLEVGIRAVRHEPFTRLQVTVPRRPV